MIISKYKLALLLELVILIAFLIFIYLPPLTPFSPLSQSNPKETPQPKELTTYKILGFAPYWNLKKITNDSLASITDFAYFALHLDENGNVQTHLNVRELEPGYLNYTRLLLNPPNKRIILTFMQKDEDSLITLLNHQDIRSHAVTTILSRAREINSTGINIDFEPTSKADIKLRNNFTAFIKELKSQSPSDYEISISIYPSAASRPRLWDLANLAQYTNYFVVMTYDYTMPKSASSGPNAPLRDISGEFEHSIIKNIAEISKIVPSRKILLGIPLYGYEWNTVDESRYSPTVGRGSTASLERIQKLLDEQTLNLVWDRNTLTPYGVATIAGATSQIYFDNDVSLRLKLDFVKDANLGGIALWALGYEGNVNWLWPTINRLRVE